MKSPSTIKNCPCPSRTKETSSSGKGQGSYPHRMTVLSRQNQESDLPPSKAVPGHQPGSAHRVAPCHLDSPGHWAGFQTPAIRALTLIWKEVVIYIKNSAFVTGQIPFVLLKTVIKKANIRATFHIPHLQDRLHETQWLALFTISGNNWAIFQHIHAHFIKVRIVSVQFYLCTITILLW